jgi:hypothetical protein
MKENDSSSLGFSTKLSKKIGIVVPTIGQRPDYLPLALESLRKSGDVFVLLVGNREFEPSPFFKSGLIDDFMVEKDPNLASKINLGLRSLPESVTYINWLGDDDLLMPDAMQVAFQALESDPEIGLVYGACQYIDSAGNDLWLQNSGAWAAKLLRFGPQLIPQPGALYRRDAFEKVGGLDATYGLAFDFKLFLELSKISKTKYLGQTLSKFRWHKDSLSVSKRRQSVSEASKIRVSSLSRKLRWLSPIWEWPIREITYLAGFALNQKLLKR